MTELKKICASLPLHGQAKYSNLHKEGTAENSLMDCLHSIVDTEPDKYRAEYMFGVLIMTQGLIVSGIEWEILRHVLTSI